MRKLFSIVLVLFMLFPSVVMAEQPKDSARTPSYDVPEKQYDLSALLQAGGENRNAAKATSGIRNEVKIIENEGEPKVSVWTPSDYDPEKKYDIFVFLQGSGENLNVAEVTATEHYGVLISDIYEAVDGDFIVVGIQDGSDFQEISGRILYALRYVADHYSTYAVSGRSKDLQIAREHVIIGGMSNDGRIATYFVTHYNAYVANAIIMSPTISMDPTEGFHLKHLFVCIGTDDNVPCRPAARQSYAKLSPYAEKAYFSLYAGRHQWKYWNIQIWLALNFVLDLGEFAEEDDSIAKLKNAVEYGDEESCNAQVHIMPFYSCRQQGPLPARR